MAEANHLLADDLNDTQRHELLQSLFDRWSADVYGFTLARCGSQPVAEDVTSEVFVAAARAIGSGNSDQVTRSWLLTAARRRLIDQWRRQRNQRNVTNKLMTHPTGVKTDSPEDRDLVHRALASLSEGQRLALTLRYLDDHSVAEVADMLGVSYSATESLLARGRRSFQQAWEKQ